MPVSFPNRYGAVSRVSARSQRLSHAFGAGMGGRTPMPTSHAHYDLELNFVYEGGIRYEGEERNMELSAGSLCAFWAAIPHRVSHLEPGTRFMWLNVPITMLLRWHLDAAFMGRVFTGELIIDPSGQPWDADLTRRWLRDLASQQSDLTRTVELEVEARIRRLACSYASAEGEVDSSGTHIAAMTAYLMDHYRDQISAGDVADAAGLNRHYAMRLFKKHSGLSIWQYLLRLRVSHAQHLLLTTDAPVVTVGLESGFTTQSRFYEIFTRECKLSPAEYRHRGATAAALAAESA